MAIYIVDSNFFIDAHRTRYPIDVAVNFWLKVKQLADEGKIFSIDKVRDELYDRNDELEQWCRANLPNNFFEDTSKSEIILEYAKISAWAYSKRTQYTQAALNEFLDADEADAFVAAFALADIENRIVVTQEISSPGSKKRVKLPDACIENGVSYVNTVEMFRLLGETF
jgi:Domain of unknown function (DUF4411)